MTEENPFKTLGFHPQAFKGLHDHEIFSLVKAQYRALMQIHHPDVAKRRNAGEKSTAITLAFGKVNLESDPANFSYWRDAFMRSNRSRNVETHAQSGVAAAREAHLQGIVVECLKGVYLKSPERPLKLPVPIATVNDGCAMALIDTVKGLWMHRQGIRIRNSFDSDIGANTPIFELETTREGLLIYRNLIPHPLSKKDEAPNPKSTWSTRNTNGVGWYWTTPPEKTRVVRGRIVGAIDNDKLRAFWDEGGSAAKRIIESGLTADETKVIETTGYTTDQVRPFLWLLKQELWVGDMVVAMSPEGDRFLFLGKLFRIADKTKAPRV